MSYINEFSKFTAIRKHFKQASDYNSFMRDLYKLYNATQENYKFLGLSEDKWFNLFKNALARNLDNLCEEALVDYIRPIIQEYIDRQVSEQRPRIFNNLISLISQEVRAAREILKRFFRELENLNINVTPEVYEFLKEKCYTLKKYLEVLGIYDMSFKEVNKFLNRERTIYDDFRNRHDSYSDSVKLLDYVLACLDDDKFIMNHKKGIKTDNHKKVKYFIDNYPYFLEIHGVIKEKYDVADKTIDVAILSCSYATLVAIVDSYRRYKVMRQDTSFMDLIVSKFNSRIVRKLGKEGSKVSTKQNIDMRNLDVKSNNLKSAQQEIDSVDEEDTSVKNKRYEYFEVNDVITERERKRRVDVLYLELTKTEQQLYDRFTRGEVSFEEAKDMLVRLKERYRSFPRIYPKHSSVLEDYFILIDGITIEERKKIIDILVERRSLDSQELIQKFREGKVSYSTISSIVGSIRTSYMRYGRKWLKPDFNPRQDNKESSYVPLEDYFLLALDITTEERAKIIKVLISRLEASEQKKIQNYRDKKVDYNTIESIVIRMRNDYCLYGKKWLVPDFVPNNENNKKVQVISPIPEKPEKSNSSFLLEKFPLIDGITEEEREKIVDILISKQTSDKQKLIQEFKDGLVVFNTIRGLIKNLQKSYKKYGKKWLEPNFNPRLRKGHEEAGATNSFGRKSLVEHFPVQECMTVEERNKIVAILLGKRSLEEQQIIKDYIAGKENYAKVKKIFASMLHSYKKYGKNWLNPDFDSTKRLPKKSQKPIKRKLLVERFPVQEDMTIEERDKIVSVLFKRLPLNDQQTIKDYYDGKIKFKSVESIIFRMQKSYQKYGKKWLIPNFNPRKEKRTSKEKERQFDNKRKKAFYSRFRLHNNITQEERNLIVDKLINNFGKNSKSLYDKYIEGLISEENEEYRLFNNMVTQLRKIYRKYSVKILAKDFVIPRLSIDKTFYDSFKLTKDINEEERQQIVDAMVNALLDDEREAILDYKNGKSDYESVRVIITRLQHRYNEYGKMILSPKFRFIKGASHFVESIYDRFPVQKGMTMEERDKIVDKMISKLTLEEQKKIQDFNAGKILFSEVEKIIYKMKSRYRRYGKRLLNDDFEFEKTKETLFDYFPIKDGISEDERDRIVLVLYASLSEEKRNEFSLYFDDFFKRTGKDIDNIRSSVINMQQIYKKYGKLLLIPYFLEVKNIRELRRLLGIKNGTSYRERERIINDFLDDYIENVINYIKYEFNISLSPVNGEKKKVLMDAIKVIEYIYREKRGLSKYEFQTYFYTRILEIFMDKPQDLESLIISFINVEYELVRDFERKV